MNEEFAVAAAEDVPGFFNRNELLTVIANIELYANAIGYDPMTFLEIGSLAGRSTTAIALSLPFQSILICVEPHIPREEGEFKEVEQMFRDTREKIIKARPDLRLIHEKKLSAEYFENTIEEEVDMVLIDGCHDYTAVREDFFNSLVICKSGGVILGHDYNRKHMGVFDFVQVLKSDPKYDLTLIPQRYNSIWRVVVSK